MLSEEEGTRYRSLVGKISYLCHTRWDILFARQLLSRFNKTPTTDHRRILHRCISYIKGTPLHGLNFTATDITTITGYSDADLAADPDSRRSISGITIYMGHNCIFAQSTKQKTVSNSSTASEIKAATACARHIAATHNLMREMHIKPSLRCRSSCPSSTHHHPQQRSG